MARVATSWEIDCARNSTRALRVALGELKTVNGPPAERLRKLNRLMDAAATSVDTIRGDVWNSSVRNLLTEYTQLEKTAQSVAQGLTAEAKSPGPFRSRMSAKEKTAFIAENGADKFLSLPN